MKRGKAYQEEGALRKAVIEYKSVLQQDPEHVEARWLLGQTYLGMQSGAAAEKELRKARELGLPDSEVLIPLARALLQQKAYREILEKIQPNPKLSGVQQAEINAIRGRAYLEVGEFDSARSALQRSLALDPENATAQVERARLAWVVEKDPEAARERLKDMVTHSDSFEAWALLGDVNLAESRLQAASKAYSKALESNAFAIPERLKRALIGIQLENFGRARKDLKRVEKSVDRHPLLAYAQGALHYAQERYGQAVDSFEEALRLERDYMPAVLYAGASHFQQGSNEQALSYLSRYVAANPRQTSARLMLGTVYLNTGQFQDAEKVVTPVLGGEASQVPALKLMSMILLAQGKTDRGLDLLRELAKRQPDSGTARARLGFTLLQLGQHEEALAELQTAVDLDPKFVPARSMLVMARLQAEEYDAALAAARRIQHDNPDGSLPWNLIGRVQLARGETDKARQAFEQALEVAPGDPGAGLALSGMALKAGRLDQADSYLRQVLQADDDNLRALQELATLQERRGQKKAARETLNRAHEVHPEALSVGLGLARMLLEKGDFSGALAVAKGMREAHPQSTMAVVMLARAQRGLGQITNAVTSLEQAVELRPKAAGIRFRLARAYIENSQIEEAKAALRTVLDLDPDHLYANVARARLAGLEGDWERAERRLARLKSAFPERAEVYGLAGWLALRQGRPEEAVPAFKQALASKESNRLVLDLVQAQESAGRFEEATATMQNWLSEHPKDQRIRYRLAVHYRESGQAQQAQKTLRKILQDAPEFVPALNDLAWMLRNQAPQEALELAEQAYGQAPESAGVLDTYGVVLLENGQARRALRLLERAHKATGRAPVTGYHLARALARTDDKARARRVLEETLANNEDFPEAKKARALLDRLNGG